MIDRWSAVRFVHVVAAMGWVGGQLLFSGVVVPVLRRELDVGLNRTVMRAAAKRFALIANAGLLPLLAGTGVALAGHRGVSWGTLGEAGYGRLLAIKLVLVVMSVGLAAGHGLLAARRPSAARALARSGLASSLGIVLFATALVP